MPPRKDRGKKSDEESSNETGGVSRTLVMTEDLLVSLVTNITRSQADSNRQLVENLMASFRGSVCLDGTSTTVPGAPTASSPFDVSAQARPGSFAKCTARFDGTSNEADVLEAFIDAVQTYKECVNVSDEHALRGLPMLLTGNAAVWWRGVKACTTSWDDALRRLRGVYGVPRPAYKVFREVFAQAHSSERADLFISRVRELPNIIMVDIVYGLLDRRIRKREGRESIKTLDELMEKARLVEESLAQVRNDNIPIVPDNAMPSNYKINLVKSSFPDCINPASTVIKYVAEASGKRGNLNTGQIVPQTESTKPIDKNKRRPRCKSCRMFGHNIDECRYKSRNIPRTDEQTYVKPSTSKEIRCYGCGQLGVVRSKCDTCRSSDKAQFQNIQIDGAGCIQPTVTINVSGFTGIAILDTGSTHCMAGPMLHKLLADAGTNFTKTYRTVRFADGSQQVREALTCDAVVTLGGREISTSFIIFPDADTRTLLGRDFIMQGKIIIDLPQDAWSFSDELGKQYPFVGSYDLPASSNPELMRVDTSSLTLRDEEGTKLTDSQRMQLNALLIRRADRFATDGPPTEYAEHHIKVSAKQEPIASSPYRLSQLKKALLEQELQKLLDAREVQEKNQELQKRYANEGRRPAPDYSEGDLVLLKTQGANNAGRGQTPKFIPRKDGPYAIKKMVSPTTYLLGKISDGELIGKYHASQLTPFVGNIVTPVREKRKRGRPKRYAS